MEYRNWTIRSGCFPFTLSLRKKGGMYMDIATAVLLIIILALINEIIKNIHKK